MPVALSLGMVRPSFLAPKPALFVGALALVFSLPGCGDDTSGDDGPATTLTSDGSTSTPMTSEGSSSTDAPGSSSGAADTTTGGAGESTGAAEDPEYPMPDGGTCGGGTAPVVLPGAEVCSPFCSGSEDPCPAASSGDAPAECTPFLGDGGSGDPCGDGMPCAGAEACGMDGTCGEVAFWACQLICGDGQACPDGMVCSGIGTCGYP